MGQEHVKTQTEGTGQVWGTWVRAWKEENAEPVSALACDGLHKISESSSAPGAFTVREDGLSLVVDPYKTTDRDVCVCPQTSLAC